MIKSFRRLCSTSRRWTLVTTEKTNTLAIRSTKDQTKIRFPFVWLRDNCQCPKCFNKTSKSRILDLKTNLKVKPLHVQLEKLDESEDHKLSISKTSTQTVSDDTTSTNEVKNILYATRRGQFKENKKTQSADNEGPMNDKIDKATPSVANEPYQLNIKWEDGHESGFPLDWLLARNFSENNRRKLEVTYKPRQTPWLAEDFDVVCSRFEYDDVAKNDRSLLEWLECLATYGVAIVENAGTRAGTLKELASRVGFLKRTQYGETFRVEAKPGTSNVAYLSSKLQLHTDLPYYEYKPGLNMLHCILQSQSANEGCNQLSDCLAVCRHLSANHPLIFDVLSKTLVDWSDYGEDDRYKFANIHRAPVICLNATGRINRINYSQPQRDSVFNVPLDEVEPWYEAMAMFTELLHDPKYMVELKLHPGDVLTFDNIRLVHGRSGYDGERLLEGGYLDWDLVRSRIRVLREELGEITRRS